MYRLASGGTPSSRQTVAAAETRRNPSRPRVDIELKTCGLHGLWWFMMVIIRKAPSIQLQWQTMSPFLWFCFMSAGLPQFLPRFPRPIYVIQRLYLFDSFCQLRQAKLPVFLGRLEYPIKMQRNHIQHHPTIIQHPTICLRSARVVLGPPSLLRPSQHEVDNSEGFEGTSPALFWVDITSTRVSWAKHAPKYAAFNWGKEM